MRFKVRVRTETVRTSRNWCQVDSAGNGMHRNEALSESLPFVILARTANTSCVNRLEIGFRTAVSGLFADGVCWPGCYSGVKEG
jgi:hypothetical protein